MNCKFNSRPHHRPSSAPRASGPPGFTLLEVLIAMAIMVFIALAIFNATTETFKLRDSLSTEGNFYNGIRMATTVMWRDISLIYSPTGSLAQASNTATGAGTGAIDPQTGQPIPAAGVLPQNDPVYQADGELGQLFPFWEPAIDKGGMRPSRFVGTETKLTFLSLSHVRIYKDSNETEFAKITYELRKEDSKADFPDGFILVKIESPNAFALDERHDTMERTFEVLHGVKSLVYTYQQRDGNGWKTFKNWDSDHQDTKNLIPDIIELKLDVYGPKKQIFEGRYKFRPEIPYNGLYPSL